jgi:hypothetical protein
MASGTKCRLMLPQRTPPFAMPRVATGTKRVSLAQLKHLRRMTAAGWLLELGGFRASRDETTKRLPRHLRWNRESVVGPARSMAATCSASEAAVADEDDDEEEERGREGEDMFATPGAR